MVFDVRRTPPEAFPFFVTIQTQDYLRATFPVWSIGCVSYGVVVAEVKNTVEFLGGRR